MKKIFFNDKYNLTQAVLEGRKTQVRQCVNLYDWVDWEAFEEGNYDCMITDDDDEPTDIRGWAEYKLGEEVAVAQCYRDICPIEELKEAYMFRGWNNKRYVKAELMPHRIKITNVRVERLKDISESDAEADGGFSIGCIIPRFYFLKMVEDLYGREAWDLNPYVFVYDFELIR